MQVLQITVTPTRYELEVEHAKLEYKQDFQPRANVKTTPPELSIRTKSGALHLDTYEARKSIGFAKVKDLITKGAEDGKAALFKSMQEAADTGEQLSRIDKGITIGDIISRKALEQPDLYTAFLPSTGADVSWQPNEFEMQYKMGKTDYDWEVKSNSMSYIPGSVRLRLIERGAVDIEYTGSPIYFPRSADPNYEEPAVG